MTQRFVAKIEQPNFTAKLPFSLSIPPQDDSNDTSYVQPTYIGLASPPFPSL